VNEIEKVERIREQHVGSDLILVPVGSLFVELSRAVAKELKQKMQRLQSI
jgi:hypothetical protein